MSHEISRRELLSVAGVTLAAGAAAGAAPKSENSKPAQFRYALNTSTIRGQNLSIEDEIDVAAKAGYGGIEVWMRKLHDYAQQGKKLSDLKKRIEGHGLKVPSAIGFAKWIADDEATRTQGLEEAKRDMDLLAQIGAERIAAPPTGATRGAALDLKAAAHRYRALLELGDAMGIVPQVEVWGFSKNLSRLSESVFVMIESGHPKACLLPDVYHVYKGGSEFSGLTLLSGRAIQVFHMNDYPADPPRETISDADRVYPGDGVAPLKSILRGLKESGFAGWLSLELFNRDYWKQNALDVARTGLAKMKEAVGKAVGG